MNSLWDDQRAAQATDDLGQCVYTARLLGREKPLVLPGGGSVSVKTTEKDLLGEDRDVLYVSGREADLATVEASGFSPVRLDGLLRLTGPDALSDALLAGELAARRADSSAPVPPAEALLHGIVPYKYAAYVHADSVLAVTNTPGGIDHVGQIYGNTVVTVPYARTDFALAKLLAGVFQREVRSEAVGIVLMKRGIVSFGETAQTAYGRLIELVSRAEEYLLKRNAWQLPVAQLSATGAARRRELAGLRQAVSAVAGFPVIMSTCSDAQCLSFARRDDLAALTQRGPALAKHAPLTGRLPLLGRDVAAFAAAHEQYFQAHAAGAPPAKRDSAPRVILDPELGMCAIGRSATEAALVGDVYRHTMEIVLRAESLERYEPAPAQDVFDLVVCQTRNDGLGGTGVSPVRAGKHGQDARGTRQNKFDRPLQHSQAEQPGRNAHGVFAGEVALVTGAASGIGKACVESFLSRGAAAVGLDVSPGIVGNFDRAGYLGLQCDVTDEDALRAALEATVKAFGGLDMLVLNAGVFPAGCRIESLQMDEWDRVMRVNLDANLVMMREAHPLLKAAPGGGRVVINGSRNVLAPGPGGAAYSTSKAALTQLARVAAMEWGSDGIRVNMIHAHAVFDTGIWTEEVLHARAKHYGMTVEEYKANNVLKVEISSHDIGEFAAEMCGPLFAKTTGAQVPIDGGSDRVI